jgi:hypothetical protein
VRQRAAYKPGDSGRPAVQQQIIQILKDLRAAGVPLNVSIARGVILGVIRGVIRGVIPSSGGVGGGGVVPGEPEEGGGGGGRVVHLLRKLRALNFWSHGCVERKLRALLLTVRRIFKI